MAQPPPPTWAPTHPTLLVHAPKDPKCGILWGVAALCATTLHIWLGTTHALDWPHTKCIFVCAQLGWLGGHHNPKWGKCKGNKGFGTHHTPHVCALHAHMYIDRYMYVMLYYLHHSLHMYTVCLSCVAHTMMWGLG